MTRRALLLAPLLAMAGLARAGWDATAPALPDALQQVDLESPFENLPRSGFLPVRVRIANPTTAPGEWTVEFSASSGRFQRGATRLSTQTLRVPAGQTGVFDLLFPVSATPDHLSGFSGNARILVTGPGLEVRPVSLPTDGRSGANLTAYVGLSSTVASRTWRPLRAEFDRRKRALSGSILDLERFGPDWRGFLALRALWLADTDYEALPPDRRAALRDWVFQGGEVFLCSTSAAPPLRGELGVPPGIDNATFGLGRVHFVAWDGRELPAEALADAVQALGGPRAAAGALEDSWALTRRVGALTWNVPLLAVGILVFAVVVGPLNLFWFAGPGRRHRLFWTTPLISLAASLGLVALIVVQDGFGGSGARALFVYLDATAKRAAVFQEQISRTGLLLGSAFSIEPGSTLDPLALRGVAPEPRNATYAESGTRLSGDWFSTRWRQAQFAQTIRPARAEVRLVSDETGPAVLSSLPGSLGEVFIADADGRVWTARDVRAGRRTPLVASDRAAIHRALADFPAGPRLEGRLQAIRDFQGWFFAFSDEGKFLPTLPSIRWRNDSALVTGPLSAP